MFTIDSMTEVAVWTTLTVAVLLYFALKTNPLRAAGAFALELCTSKKYALHFLAMLMILLFNKVEQWVENRMEPPPDFTSYVFRLEGSLVAFIQRAFQSSALTSVSVFFYIVVFPAVMIASIAIYTHRKQHRLYYAVCYALMINYMLAIPFYLLFPVQEVWHFQQGVQFLIPDVFPSFEQEYRPLSGLDNCFPSLHTSISVSMAILAGKSENAFWRMFTRFHALFIIFSIFYLGVHWVTDMMAGLALGIFAATLALRLSEGRTPLGAFNQAQWKSRQLGGD